MTQQTQTALRSWSSRKNLPLARSTAQDPGAAPATLTLLAQLTDLEVLRSLTKNPSTPTKALLTLAEKFPAELIENPILPLLLLENPHTIFDWTKTLQEKLLLCPSLPSELFEIILSRGAERFRALVNDPKAPAPLLERLAPHVSPRALSLHPNATPKTIAIAVTSGAQQSRASIAPRLGEYRPLLQRAGLWGAPMKPTPSLSEGDLWALSELGQQARALVAAHPECPEALLHRLLDDKESAVCYRAALHPKLPKERLPELISRFDEISHLLAMDARLSAEQLSEIFTAEDKHGAAKGIAKNPNAPPALLQSLLWCEHQAVRAAAAQHQNTPPEELERLYRLGASLSMTLDGRPDPEVPPEELTALSISPEPFILELVARHPNTPLDALKMLSHKTESLRHALLQNPSTLCHLEALFTGNPRLMLNASAKKNLPIEIYEHLCEQPAPAIKQRLAKNPTLPNALLERLTQDLNPKTQTAAKNTLLRRQATLEVATSNSHQKRRHPRPQPTFSPDNE